MKFRANRNLEFLKDGGWEDYGTIPEGALCEARQWWVGGYEAIFYKGTPVCDVNSGLGKSAFDKVKYQNDRYIVCQKARRPELRRNAWRFARF